MLMLYANLINVVYCGLYIWHHECECDSIWHTMSAGVRDAFWCYIAAVPVKLHYTIIDWTRQRVCTSSHSLLCRSHFCRCCARSEYAIELHNKVGGWFAKFRSIRIIRLFDLYKGTLHTRRAPESNDHTLMQFYQKWPDRISMALKRVHGFLVDEMWLPLSFYQKQMFGICRFPNWKKYAKIIQNAITINDIQTLLNLIGLDAVPVLSVRTVPSNDSNASAQLNTELMTKLCWRL